MKSDSHGNEIKFGYNVKKENRKVHIYRINRDSFLGAQTLWQTIRIEPTKDCYYTFSALVSNDVSYSNPTNTCRDVSDDKCLEKLGKTGDKIKVSSRMFLEKAKSGYFIIYTNIDNVKVRN